MNQTGPARGHILAIDDQQPNLTLLTQMLEAEGHVVRTAVTGLSALEAIGRQPPDLILLDVGLPDINGFEVCRRLKQNPLTRLTRSMVHSTPTTDPAVATLTAHTPTRRSSSPLSR